MRKRWYAWLLVPAVLLATMGADGGCEDKEHPANGGHPAPAKQQPAPKADPNPHRTDQIKRTYLFRIEVKQFPVLGPDRPFYVSHQISTQRDVEEEFSDETWWVEQQLVPGDKLWIHVVRPRGGGIITCKIYYIPGHGLGWKTRRSRTIVGAGSCDATYYVTHREEYE